MRRVSGGEKDGHLGEPRRENWLRVVGRRVLPLTKGALRASGFPRRRFGGTSSSSSVPSRVRRNSSSSIARCGSGIFARGVLRWRRVDPRTGPAPAQLTAGRSSQGAQAVACPLAVRSYRHRHRSVSYFYALGEETVLRQDTGLCFGTIRSFATRLECAATASAPQSGAATT